MFGRGAFGRSAFGRGPAQAGNTIVADGEDVSFALSGGSVDALVIAGCSEATFAFSGQGVDVEAVVDGSECLLALAPSEVGATVVAECSEAEYALETGAAAVFDGPFLAGGEVSFALAPSEATPSFILPCTEVEFALEGEADIVRPAKVREVDFALDPGAAGAVCDVALAEAAIAIEGGAPGYAVIAGLVGIDFSLEGETDQSVVSYGAEAVFALDPGGVGLFIPVNCTDVTFALHAQPVHRKPRVAVAFFD